ncbi:TspO and MBR related proteins [Enhydrobacter aerosaccus]|uniref:TspO and MBR related proteins n=1 Tax=Enhydrobacter aerosaccus TaxID=225324 RepID=A0A1T4S218_9HYPH|nr:TspO/MBR family protein [Enhydrobacter aerosaccus]SKA22217.1 TspO and MBR related proteins [Enhydrobacter aerosaccus]
MSKRGPWLQGASLVFFLALCLGIGLLGSWVTAGSVTSWYPTLRKPSFNPPDWVFAPVWTTLYILMAIAGWRIWRHTPHAGSRLPLLLFALQLVLNLCWSVTFFGFHSLSGAVVVIVALDMAVLATMFSFRRVDLLAVGLLVPYLLWISFATVLTVAIWRLNQLLAADGAAVILA